MKRYWIVGAGKFGQKAAAALIKNRPQVEITLIDRCAGKLPDFPTATLQPVREEGVRYLVRHLTAPACADWIVPAIPVHVAFEWLRRRLEGRFRLQKIPVPSDILAALPNPIAGPEHRVYASVATFRCPEDCPEPANFCTHTGKPRPCTLNRLLAEIGKRNPATVVVVRSRQLAPGVGGYRPADMFAALDSAVEAAGNPIVLATACRCHGVLDAFGLDFLF